MKTKIYEELSDLFPLWRETTLGQKGHEKREVAFIKDIFALFPDEIKTVIDLGGGVGMHAGLLAEAGHEVTLIDRSQRAIEIAQATHSKITAIQVGFEELDIPQTFDSAICMWSTLSYIYSEEGRQNFYRWQSQHIDKVIVLDEANFYRYPANFEKIYEGENDHHRMKIHRQWTLDDNHCKQTKFLYEIEDKDSGQIRKISDQETEQYIAVAAMQTYLGDDWNLFGIYGDYDVRSLFNQETSPRILAVFFRK